MLKNVSDWVISSQAAERSAEGSTTRAWSLTETVKPHECAAPHEGEDIVWTGAKATDAELKCTAITQSNTATNVVGACFIRGDQNPTTACFGAVITRDVRLESIRVARSPTSPA
ncbi:MAG: hypothetical protein ACYS7Y_36165 [Planctomycetota bacterium]|jgi:hypothetical protein